MITKLKAFTAIIILGAVFAIEGSAQTENGTVKIVERKIPRAEISVTGIGYPPKKDVSPAQKRLLARRAATINAYKNLAEIINGVSGYIDRGTGMITASGYIVGAEITQVREFPEGKMEVDLSVPVNLKGRKIGQEIVYYNAISDISNKGYRVYFANETKSRMTQDDWNKIVNQY